MKVCIWCRFKRFLFIVLSALNGVPQEKDLFWYPFEFNAAGVGMIDYSMGILLWNWENIIGNIHTYVQVMMDAPI